jgi:hypothetical protein
MFRLFVSDLENYNTKELQQLRIYYNINPNLPKTVLVRMIARKIMSFHTYKKAQMPPYDYSRIQEVTDFGLTNPNYPDYMTFDELGHKLAQVYQRGNRRLLLEFKNSFIDGEKIVFYSVHSNGNNWLLTTNYARVFRGGNTPEIKEFNYWILPEHILLMRKNSLTVNEKKYDPTTAEELYELLDNNWRKASEKSQATKHADLNNVKEQTELNKVKEQLRMKDAELAKMVEDWYECQEEMLLLGAKHEQTIKRVKELEKKQHKIREILVKCTNTI